MLVPSWEPLWAKGKAVQLDKANSNIVFQPQPKMPMLHCSDSWLARRTNVAEGLPISTCRFISIFTHLHAINMYTHYLIGVMELKEFRATMTHFHTTFDLQLQLR